MKSQTSIIANQVRLKEWADLIRECQSRPAGMTVDEWCHQAGITKANYYWRLKRVREACIQAVENSSTEFVELPIPLEAETQEVPAKHCIAAVLHGPGAMVIEITNAASMEFIKSLLGAFNRC